MSAPQFQMHRVVGAQARNLNQSQLAVLALPPSAVVAVFGAPGAGKTETLKATLVDRIRSGQLKSADVLAVAATRSSAATLRDELALALQSATKGPLARTLASLAFAVVAGKEMSVGALDPELVSGSEQDQLLQGILNDLDAEGSIAWPESMPLATRSLTGFRAELRDVITVALEHQVSPDELSRLSTSSKYSVWHQVAEVYRRYLAKLASFDRVRFDAATLLQSATDILQGGFWPKNLARPKLILVDDAQELTPAAIRLLQQLVGSESGLILFGDPDASTLGFRAADPKAMSNLVAQINADRGTTSSAIFLDARAERLAPALQRAMAKAAEKVSPELAGRHRLAPIADGASEASAEPNAAIQTAKFDSPSTETAWLADRLRYFHLEQGIAWRDMAVVARTRKQLEELELALANQQVPARIGGARTPLRDEFGSRSLLIVARAALMPDELDLPTVIELLANPFVNLSSVQVRRLRRTLRGKQDPEVSKKNSDELLVELFNNPLAFPDHVSAELVEVQKFLAVFHSVRAQLRERKVGIEHALWGLFTNSAPQSKWLEYAASGGEVAAQASRNLDALSALFAAAKRFAERNPGVAPHEFVERQLALGLPEDTLIKNARSLDWLPLVTPAGLIGQRFKVVALPRLVDGIWPNPKQRSTLLGAAELGQVLRGQEVAVDETANELRMFYKAVGAADQHVLATVSESESDSQSSFFQLVFEVDPASGEYPTGERSLRTLVGKLRRSLVSDSNLPPYESRANNVHALARLSLAGVAGADPSQWLGILEPSTSEPLFHTDGDLDSAIPISPSQLERFIECPLHWFISYHGGDDAGFEASLGTILHSALEKSKTGSAAELEALVDEQWPSLRFEADWLSRTAKRKALNAINNIAQYLSDFNASGSTLVSAEAQFKFNFGEAEVNGKIDRIERTADGELSVVDLKTGKARNYTVADTEVNPQLLTYQLGIELDQKLAGELREHLKSEPKLEGAKLVIVGDEKPATRTQASIQGDNQLRETIKDIIKTATTDMSQPIFVAKIGKHCDAARFGEPCKLHIIEAVSYVG